MDGNDYGKSQRTDALRLTAEWLELSDRRIKWNRLREVITYCILPAQIAGDGKIRVVGCAVLAVNIYRETQGESS